MTGTLTDDEARNGWTPAALAAYRAEREDAAPLVGGNIVTEWTRPRQLPRIENTRSHDPHKHWRAT